MTNSKVPPIAKDTQTESLLSMARCCGATERQAVYVSTPITTGQAFLAWRRAYGKHLSKSDPTSDTAAHKKHVISANIERASAVVEHVRNVFDKMVIDPTSLHDIPGWKQSDYHSLWTLVIDRYASTVVFVDGWQYSTGCVLEFAAAVGAHAELRTQDLQILDARKGLEMIRAAVNEVSESHVEMGPLYRAADDAEVAIARADGSASA